MAAERTGRRPARPDELRRSQRREKAVAQPLKLREAIERFDAFVRPLLEGLAEEEPRSPGGWEAGGPWRRPGGEDDEAADEI
jgi:hypothetical protein